MKPRRKTEEQDFQRQVAQYLTLALPTPEAWFTSIPAGWGGMTRGPGYKAGTPDVLVIYRHNIICVPSQTKFIWMELKSARGTLSKAQEHCRDDLVALDCKWALVRSLDDVEKVLRRFGVPLRASVGAG